MTDQYTKLPMALGQLQCTDRGVRFSQMRSVIDCDIEVWGQAQIDEYTEELRRTIDALSSETDLLRKTLEDMAAGIPARDAEIVALRAERDRLRNALELFISHSPEPECAIWRHVHDVARAALSGDLNE